MPVLRDILRAIRTLIQEIQGLRADIQTLIALLKPPPDQRAVTWTIQTPTEE